MISIWSMGDSALVARCQGHQSWVASVAFDPWRCDDRNYRFGSVGEDGRLCLWDFSVGMLHRPRAVSSILMRGGLRAQIRRNVYIDRVMLTHYSNLYTTEGPSLLDSRDCSGQRQAGRGSLISAPTPFREVTPRRKRLPTRSNLGRAFRCFPRCW